MYEEQKFPFFNRCLLGFIADSCHLRNSLKPQGFAVPKCHAFVLRKVGLLYGFEPSHGLRHFVLQHSGRLSILFCCLAS